LVVPQPVIDDVGNRHAQIRFRLMPVDVKKIYQFLQISLWAVEPGFIFYRADLMIVQISEDIDHVCQPAILADFRFQPVPLEQRATDLGGVAETEHDSLGEPQIPEDLMPHRQQARRPGILEPERCSVRHSRIEERLDFLFEGSGADRPTRRAATAGRAMG
jgi:hypothetical protein